MVNILIFMSLALFAMPAAVSGDDDSTRPPTRQRTILPAGHVVHGDYFAFGPRVVISGTVHGDVYVGGGRVLVDGVINGDLIAVGSKVIVSGRVAQDARIISGHVVLIGSIGKNATLVGADIQITRAAGVEGNVVAAGGEVEIDGPVSRDARIAAGSVTVSNHIGRDLSVAGCAVRLTSSAAVDGRVRYWADEEPVIDEGATIHGPVTHRRLPGGWQAEGFRRGFAGLRLFTWGVSLVSTLILGLILLHVYPIFTRRVSSIIRERPWRSLGWGTTALVGTPLVVLALLVTILGLPIGVILLALYLVMLYLARIYAMTYIGQVLLRRTADSSPLSWCFVTGLAVYALLALIPVVGEFVTFMTVLFGLGALLAAEKDLVVALREQKLV